MISKVLELNPKKILDVGCGDGRFLYSLKRHMPANALKGVDMSEKGIAFAKAFNPEVDITLLNICTDRYAEKFDCVILTEVLEHIHEDTIPSFLKGICENMSDEGALLITVPSTNESLNPKHYRHYDVKKLKEHVEADTGLKIVKTQYIQPKNVLFRIYSRITRNRYLGTSIFDNLFYKFLLKNMKLHPKMALEYTQLL